MVELHRCKVCGVLFGTEGPMTGHDASVCPSCQKRADPELREEDKPGCFGAIGKIGKRKDPECPCAWKDRCRQSQEDC